MGCKYVVMINGKQRVFKKRANATKTAKAATNARIVTVCGKTLTSKKHAGIALRRTMAKLDKLRGKKKAKDKRAYWNAHDRMLAIVVAGRFA